jgi:hypothetical protein
VLILNIVTKKTSIRVPDHIRSLQPLPQCIDTLKDCHALRGFYLFVPANRSSPTRREKRGERLPIDRISSIQAVDDRGSIGTYPS